MSTIQTNRSGLIHVLTEMQVFRDQIPTQVQCKQEDYIDWESVIAQRRCPEEMYSQIVDFLQKPLPDQYPDMWLKFDPVGDANARVQRKDLPWWLIFRTTPYLSTILANMSGCAVFYSNVAMSRQRVLITDHFCTQIPTQAISRCFGLSWRQILWIAYE